jgi:hypothetical protein
LEKVAKVKRRHNSLTLAEIKTLREHGATFTEIGDRLGVSRQRAQQICSRNLKIPNARVDFTARNSAIIERFRAGVAAVEIAAQFSVKRHYVFSICRGKVSRWERGRAKEALSGTRKGPGTAEPGRVPSEEKDRTEMGKPAANNPGEPKAPSPDRVLRGENG